MEGAGYGFLTGVEGVKGGSEGVVRFFSAACSLKLPFLMRGTVIQRDQRKDREYWQGAG